MKILFCAISTIVLIGCETTSPYLATNFRIGENRSANVGGRILDVVTGDQNKRTSDIVNTFSQILIYGGIDGNTIQVTYRELSNNYARPAFTQELKYDLSKNKIINYDEYRIEVLEANNEKIVFKVLDAPDNIKNNIARSDSSRNADSYKARREKEDLEIQKMLEEKNRKR